jgi:hypothetical protein
VVLKGYPILIFSESGKFLNIEQELYLGKEARCAGQRSKKNDDSRLGRLAGIEEGE